jgi:putative oxidoreductase
VATPVKSQGNISDGRPTSDDKPDSQGRSFWRGGFFVRVAPLILRGALAVTLVSAVADRFGLWGPAGAANVAWGDWSHFVAYTAKVNSFLPQELAQVLAVMATAAETVLGVALVLGVFPRLVAWATAALLCLFAVAMTASFGMKAPLNYSVFVDAAAALLLATWPRTWKSKSDPLKTG